MANSLGSCVTRFTSKLDGILEQGPLTNDLNMNTDLVGDFVGAGQVQVAKIALQGLADYSRNSFVAGDINFSWEALDLAYDRGREFSIDEMDDEERARIVSMNVMGEFARTKVVPEVDAIRFAKLAGSATAQGTATPGTYSTAAAAETAVLDAEEYVQDMGSLLSGCVLYCTSHVKRLLREATPYKFGRGDNPSTNFETFDDMKVVTVPQNRFYTALDLLDGTTSGEEAGGYVKHVSTGSGNAAGKDINFMVVDPACCAAITKHQQLRYFAPEVNQKGESHLWQYRLYHDLLVYENKAGAIYLSAKA